MTKMADIPMYGKNPLKSSAEPEGRWPLDMGYGAYQVYSNDDPRLTLTYIT